MTRKCIGCKRKLAETDTDWGFVNADGKRKVAECDACYQKRFASRFPHVQKVRVASDGR